MQRALIQWLSRTQFLAGLCLMMMIPESARGDDLVTLANVVDPGPITADEPIAEVFSAEKAARYLDTAALHWQKERNCAACHIKMGYMFARPAGSLGRPEASSLVSATGAISRRSLQATPLEPAPNTWFVATDGKDTWSGTH